MPSQIKTGRRTFGYKPENPSKVVGEFTICFHVNSQASFHCWMRDLGPGGVAITPPMLSRVMRGSLPTRVLRGFITEIELERRKLVEAQKE